ncbi:MAG: hypothetical protein QN193_07550 [Armatimonadota bacterium]|nr:hypothetical protein [Armatimonadota bacterium]MDR7570446.1 hypothetical protein [Armatimonadota bacterium]MDR7613245.1 hypothetical protein [Armatimonadota bacterium]
MDLGAVASPALRERGAGGLQSPSRATPRRLPHPVGVPSRRRGSPLSAPPALRPAGAPRARPPGMARSRDPGAGPVACPLGRGRGMT